MESVEILAQELQLNPANIQGVLDMFAEGATIPFIARYRKEQTGGLDEETLLKIQQEYAYQENLKERKEAVLRLIEEKGLLTDEVRKRIEACTKLAQVEDLYRPYKEKKLTKASAAIAAGLEPLAKQIAACPAKGDWDSLLAAWTEKTGKTADELKEQAGYIIAQNFSDDPDNRERMKKWLLKNASLKSALKKDVEDTKYEMYHDFSSPVRMIKPHQVMAMNRAEKEKVITVSLVFDDAHPSFPLLKLPKKANQSFAADYVKACIQDGWKRLLLPSLTREIRRELLEDAQNNAIETFQVNLENLLMTRPLGACRVLGFDPGYAHGCKLAMLDEYGNMLDTMVVYPFVRGDKAAQAAEAQVARWIKDYQAQYIAIGNGTASRESEAFIAKLIRDHDFKDVKYAIVSEAGASVYSASDLAREEFPDLEVEKRSAVSIGRRIQDPLSELVKIDPKSIGVGEYQHDVNQKQLSGALDFVTQKVVNAVGVNINTASPAILAYISGLKKPAINSLVKARKDKPIASRREIAGLKGISDKVYEQCIGFIRVPESDEPLDATGIHPESYRIAYQILDLLHLDPHDMRTPEFRQAIRKASPIRLAKQCSSDTYTIKDILKELANPGLDPRDSLDGPMLRSDILSLKDLKPGMALQGTVRNVTSFGAFIDIGLHSDGLVHVSKMADHRIHDPKEVVSLGDIVTCYVLNIDEARERVSLSLIPA